MTTVVQTVMQDYLIVLMTVVFGVVGFVVLRKVLEFTEGIFTTNRMGKFEQLSIDHIEGSKGGFKKWKW